MSIKKVPIYSRKYIEGIIQATTQTFEVVFTDVTEYTVDHNLNKYPIIQVLNEANDEVEVMILHTNKNSFTVSWNGNMTGTIIYY